MGLKLDDAQAIMAAALKYARANNLKPMGFVVLDERGALRTAAVEDGTSLARWKVAFGKAHGALSMGVSSRKLNDMAVERPHFIASLASVFGEGLVPVPRGVLSSTPRAPSSARPAPRATPRTTTRRRCSPPSPRPGSRASGQDPTFDSCADVRS